MSSQPDDLTANPAGVISALRAERDAGLAREAALTGVMDLINQHPESSQPALDAILEVAVRLSGSGFGGLLSYDGHLIRLIAWYGSPPTPNVVFSVEPGTLMHRIVLGEDIVSLADVRDDDAYRAGIPSRVAIVDRFGARTQLMAGLRKDGRLLGFINIFRREVRPFSETELGVVKAFASQAVIAMENARLITEQQEALEQQTATAEVLQVINANPGDLEPVFEAILEKAMRLCASAFGTLLTYDGVAFHTRTVRGVNTANMGVLMAPTPQPRPGMALYRILQGADIYHLDDCADDEAYRSGVPSRVALVDAGGARTVLLVALRKDNKLLGVINIFRQEVRPFTEKQVALLQGFAAQAVIAMENARLLGELRERTSDLQESLEYQTATSDVLKVISRSTFDLQPMLSVVAETAARLCAADQAAIFRHENNMIELVANFGFPPEYESDWAERGSVLVVTDTPAVVIRAILERHAVHIHDVATVPDYPEGAITLGRQHTSLGVPLLREGEPIGVILIARQRVEPFTDRQIELVKTFADQAVIAIENTRLITEQQEALEQQTATAEVLQVINSNPGDVTPVFDVILDKAHALCGASVGSLVLYDGTMFRAVAIHGWPDSVAAIIRESSAPNRTWQRLIDGERFIHILDVRALEAGPNDAWFEAGRAVTDTRTALFVPLHKDRVLLGFISAFRSEVRMFAEKEVALLENFAAQAVIAMDNARLLQEQREALEQQTATAEVLGVINANPGNLAPVFDAILDKAHSLCGAEIGNLALFDGEYFQAIATHGFSDAAAARFRKPFLPNYRHRNLIEGGRYNHVPDIRTIQVDPTSPISTLQDMRTLLSVPLRKDGAFLGLISAYRLEVRPFSEKEIALLENFAAQAVIAMENARLLNEVRQRQEELRITFENMGDGVAMFDATPRLVAWNRKFQEILDVPDDVFAERKTYEEYIRYLTARGEFGPDADPEVQIRRLTGWGGQPTVFERTRPNGRTIEVHYNPVPTGGFVLIYADITERKQNEQALRAARDASDAALRELKTAQANLIQAEKMASLGQLTAGIAHEIKNPLNFVNNFADLSVELLAELKETAAPGFAALDENARADIDDLSATLTSNLGKIVEHGRRADGIVRAMLEHSRGASGERRTVNLNNLAEEALNLAYHGARAQDQSFNITLERVFDSNIPPIELNPQDITRVLLNLFSNGFYAARKRQQAEPGHDPVLKVSTRDLGGAVEIVVRDNGTGIPAEIKDKLFEPFFTTKPTGEGTGLGLSISYDVVTKQHGGTIAVDSEPDAYTAFTVTLPRRNT